MSTAISSSESTQGDPGEQGDELRITHEVDVAVLGGGTAGMNAFRSALKERKTAVMIERGPWGTTCARVGCMPSKLLIAAADAAHHAKDAGPFGVRVPTVEIDGPAVMKRVRSERDRFVGFVVRSIEHIDPSRRIDGEARFVDDHTLAVRTAEGVIGVRAKAFVIATGSTPRVLPFLEKLGDRLIVNDDLFEMEDLPESVLLFGPGVIGLELGQALHRLGVRVRIFGRGGFIGPFSDPKIKEYATDCFREELALDTDASFSTLERLEDGSGVRLVFTDKDTGGEKEEQFEYVLAAIGRTPNLSGIGLENTSLTLDERGMPEICPYTQRAGETNLFVAGDAADHRPILHEASDEGRAAGTNAAHPTTAERRRRRSPLAVVFTDPQMAMVGSRWADLDERHTVVGEVSFENQGRSRVMRKNKGMLRVYFDDRDERFVGAEMLGPSAEHLGHLLAWAHQSRLILPEMLGMPFYHPVVEEGLRTALVDAAKKLKDPTARRQPADGPGS